MLEEPPEKRRQRRLPGHCGCTFSRALGGEEVVREVVIRAGVIL